MHCRYPASHRLKNRGDFLVMHKTPRRLRRHGAGFDLLMLPHTQAAKPCRLGIQISRKHVRLAVQRNSFRRLMREMFRTHQCRDAHYDLLLRSRKGLSNRARPDFRADVASTLSQLEEALLLQ